MNVVEASMLLRFSTLAGAFALCGCGSLLGLDDFTDAGEGGASASAGGGSTTTVTSTSDATQVASSSSSATQGAGGGGGENVGPGAGGGVTSSVTTSVTTSTSTSTTVGAGGAGPECPVDTVCVPDAPNGWTGPAAIYVGDAPPAECPAPWTETITANAGNVQGAHTCSPCTCGDATGAQCSAPQIRVYGTGTCTGTPGTYTLPTNGTCVDTGGATARAGRRAW